MEKIRNLHNWDKGFDEGYHYWEEGDKERKNGHIKRAIELFDKSRYNGYNAPALYNSYAMVFRELKVYDNEIAILDEAIEQMKSENVSEITVLKFKERREKAIALRQKQNREQ